MKKFYIDYEIKLNKNYVKGHSVPASLLKVFKIVLIMEMDLFYITSDNKKKKNGMR